jgi:hypothetical protein
MRMMMLVVAVATACLAGCSAPAESGWRPPGDYAYTLESSCGERLVHGKIRLTVKGGAVTEAVGLDESGRATVDLAKLDRLPTLDDLVEEYNTAVRNGAHKAEAQFGEDGRPIRIDLDQRRNAIDDEACYVISDYVVTG